MKLKQIIFSLYKLISKLGIHVLPVHYYSPVPDINELKKTKNIWAKKSDLPGINIDLNKQVSTLKKICLPYQVEYENNVEYIYAVKNGFGPGFDFIEAQTLHAVIRYFKPKNIIAIAIRIYLFFNILIFKNIIIFIKFKKKYLKNKIY